MAKGRLYIFYLILNFYKFKCATFKWIYSVIYRDIILWSENFKLVSEGP